MVTLVCVTACDIMIIKKYIKKACVMRDECRTKNSLYLGFFLNIHPYKENFYCDFSSGFCLKSVVFKLKRK